VSSERIDPMPHRDASSHRAAPADEQLLLLQRRLLII
jgi:hypothetical protein